MWALPEARGWSRERLAQEACISNTTLARLEGEGAIQPGFFTVGAVAEALDISLDDLFRDAHVAPGLWSAGYEGRDIDSFVASLLDSRIDVVADVRLTPISRKKGFSKTRLGQALAEAGIEYTHLRGLGNPKENRAPFWDGQPSPVINEPAIGPAPRPPAQVDNARPLVRSSV
ncbi:helix-turn-helix protein [Streptomyces puniciscabiei]|uniref:Helix-turn-helix protein n=1 Tax=Streptomyces puniciscabiei TaxID=164348 RepID=A0A542UEP3_9ACTN|nr:helix-turn-helix protein [Streptomyces puniciscabiei]